MIKTAALATLGRSVLWREPVFRLWTRQAGMRIMMVIICTHYQHLHTDQKERLCYFPRSLKGRRWGASPFLSVSESRLLSMAVAVPTATTHIFSGLHSSRTLSISDTFSSFKTFAKIIKQSCKDDQKTKQYKISFLTTHSGLQYWIGKQISCPLFSSALIPRGNYWSHMCQCHFFLYFLILVWH